MLEVAALYRSFGRSAALRGVDLAVARGELVGLVGPNGAGKTTLLRVLAGYLDADRGRVVVGGRVGYLPESAPLPPEARIGEHLALRAALKGVPRRARAGAVDAALARCGLAGQARRVISTLSKGYRQRVGLADALLGDPPIVLLDEPASGLDPLQARELRALLAELAVDRAVIVSTHTLGELEALAARVAVIAAGRIAGDGTVAELRAAAGAAPDASLEDIVIALVSRAQAA